TLQPTPSRFPFTALFRSYFPGISNPFFFLFADFLRLQIEREAFRFMVNEAGVRAQIAAVIHHLIQRHRIAETFHHGRTTLATDRSEEHTSELQSRENDVC